jgi:hypothetical protein
MQVFLINQMGQAKGNRNIILGAKQREQIPGIYSRHSKFLSRMGFLTPIQKEDQTRKVHPVRNSSGGSNSVGIIPGLEPAAERRRIISNGVNFL